MSSLIQTNNGWSLPETLRQGSAYMGGQVLFDSTTGQRLAPNTTTLSRPMGSTPSYQNLTATPSPSGGTVPTQLAPAVNVSPQIMSFTDALIRILKDAQGQNQTGQAALMKQSQGITNQGITDAISNFKDPLLRPNDSSSLGMSAQNEFDPSLNSIADQQKLATQNLGNITDLVNMTGDNYQKEQDRIAKTKQDALDNANKNTANNTIKLTPSDKQGLIAAGFLPAEISSIESDINKYGINKVVEGITDTKQKDAIYKVYGGTTKDTATKLTRPNVALMYGLTDNGSKTGFMGWGKTTSQQLDDIMNTIQRYQAVGYTDDQILKLLQG